MKKVDALIAFLILPALPLLAQVDTTFLYGPKPGDNNFDIRIYRSPTDYYFLEEDRTFSFRMSNGEPTNTYYDMTSGGGWNSAVYTEGHLRKQTGVNSSHFRMNYRLLHPQNYDPTYEEGYPLIIMTHGFGERGNCWVKRYPDIVDCYWGNLSWNPLTNNPAAPTDSAGDYARLLNNDHNLTQGGKAHWEAVERSAGKLPNDPTLHTRAFPGFVLFPQNLNGWSYIDYIYDAIRLVRLVSKKYNIDPNRIYIHGLSDGGMGTYSIIRRAPWLFASVITMSAVTDGGLRYYNLGPEVASIPLWTFQGGKDGDPTPAETVSYVDYFRSVGMSVRYTLYPHLGHGTWASAYNEPDFFMWMREKNKANPHLMFNRSNICGTSGAGVEMVYSKGFFAYQWEKDGQIIPGATSYSYTAAIPGVYRGRFSRVPNPGTDDWNRWSDPIVVQESAPAAPAIIPNYSTTFPNINSDNIVTLKASVSGAKYRWYKDGAPLTLSDTVSQLTITKTSTASGAYTLHVVDGDCESNPSEPVYVQYDAPASLNTPTPGSFTGNATSPFSAFLSWTDNIPNERGYEIWRRKGNSGKFVFAGLTPANAVSFHDTTLEASTEYQYKLRAVSNTARSLHAPGDGHVWTNSLIVTTPGDTATPGAPQNLTIVSNTQNSITLSWTPPADRDIVKYVIAYGSNSVEISSSLTQYTLTGLTINTAYPITVRAKDYTDLLSPPSNQVIGNTFFEGLNYTHTTGAWSSLTNIDWSVVEFSGKVTNFSLDVRTQDDYFNVKFDGYINITTTGTYQFRTTSDDGSMMYLDGFNPVLVTPAGNGTPPVYDLSQYRIISNDSLHGMRNRDSNPISLAQGFYRVVVIFFEQTGGQGLTVSYRMQNSNGTWPAFAPIPASMLRSGTYTPPPSLNAPTELTAVSSAMTQVNLSWQYGGPGTDEFEIYRSVASDGTYTFVDRVGGVLFTDTNLTPGTTYYYKLKTVNSSGATSASFSNTANATTGADTEAPSVPGGMQLLSKTYTNVAFKWNAATDNVLVTGYQVLINGTSADSVDLPGYMATELSPNTTYNLSVKAYDASGNLSGSSSILTVTTDSPAQYYSASVGNLNNLSTWGTEPDGSGANPPGFDRNGQIFILSNRTSTDIGGNLTIGGSSSRLIVPDDVTLTINGPVAGKIEVQGSSVVILNHSSIPEFTSISPAATLHFNGANAIPAGTYGNVYLNGSGNKNFAAGDVVIMGNLSVSDGIALKGAPANASRLTVHGNITINGTPAEVAHDNGLHIHFAGGGTKQLTVDGTFNAYRFSTEAGTTINVVNASGPATINLGSLNGGGLELSDGSVMNFGNNTLRLSGTSVINATGQTGQLAINDGTLEFLSSGSQHSSLYFHPSLHTARRLEINATGTGSLNIQSTVNISESLKVGGGTLNTGGHVTLLSDEAFTAGIEEIEGGVINGDVNVQRWIDNIGQKYRYLSSPVAGLIIADWQQYIPVTGSFEGSSPQATAPSMFYFSEPGGWQPYPPAGTSNQQPLQRGAGYSIYLWNGNSEMTMTMSGNPYQGNVPFTLTPQTGELPGWNLLGNPYASTIQWSSNPEAWIKSGVSTTVYVRDNNIGQFRFYDAETGNGNLEGGTIAPGQSFWIQTTNASPSLTITEKAKYSGQSVLLRESAPTNSLAIHLERGTQSDPAYIVLGEHYDDAYVVESDARKRTNAIFNLSTLAHDSIDVSINKISNKFCEKTIRLNIRNTMEGQYTLVFSNVESLFDIRELTLVDNFTGTATDIKLHSSYTFAVTSAPESSGASRFSVTFKRAEAVADFNINATDVCGGNEAVIRLSHTQPGARYFASLSGVAISDSVLSKGQDVALIIPVELLNNGSNTLKVYAGVPGCGSVPLFKEVSLLNTLAPVATAEETSFSICQGSELSLEASGAPEGGSYTWYDMDGTVMHRGSEPVFTVSAVRSSGAFQVTAVHANGCEGAPVNIFVQTEDVPQPVVALTDSTLHLTSASPDETIFRQWYKDGEPLPVYETSMKAGEPGAYTILLSSNGCSRISEPYYFGTSITGLDPEQSADFDVYAYPNPVFNSDLYIRLTSRSLQTTYVTLTDMTGRNFYSSELAVTRASGVYRIKPSDDMAAGVYIITVVQGDVQVTRRVVIVK